MSRTGKAYGDFPGASVWVEERGIVPVSMRESTARAARVKPRQRDRWSSRAIKSGSISLTIRLGDRNRSCYTRKLGS